MANEYESPLIKALPPQSDYLTYLTIVEYNLTSEALPILHKVLQDETLTTNIGWDLVHLLLPHLPGAEACLHDIARLGNPREVILKVTESLRLIGYDGIDDDHEDDHDESAEGAGLFGSRPESSTYPIETQTEAAGVASTQAEDSRPALPLPVNQFVSLLSMLAVLLQRIKTKYPSRFLSTTLQAILASYSHSTVYREEMIGAIVKFVKLVTGIHRPSLPSRNSNGMLEPRYMATDSQAEDPEASTSLDTSVEETAMQRKLLQSFVTHVMEEYMLNFPAYDDVPGMAWCSRIMEKMHPERRIPDGIPFAIRFANEERLQRRIDALGQLATLAQDLKLSDEQLWDAAITAETMPDSEADEDEPPRSAKDIPLSRLGSLLLYSAKQASAYLYDRPTSALTGIEIFPDHQELLKNCLASHEMGSGQLGTEPEALVDSVLALGIVCLEQNDIGRPSDGQFNDYLQVTALLSSNCPNANLRGHAHYLTSTVLRSQPDEEVRLSFIRDTLEHCPFENLKVSAVGWLKGETIEANSLPEISGRDDACRANSPARSIFAQPVTLRRLAPYLFPPLRVELVLAPIQEAWVTFQTNLSFYLASLNFIYLLLRAQHARQVLEIAELWTSSDIAGSFLQPLGEARTRFGQEMEDGGALLVEKNDTSFAELNLLEETINRVAKAVKDVTST